MASLSYIPVPRLIDLLRSPEVRPDMFVRVLSGNRLALGTDPLQPALVVDLSRERVAPYAPASNGGPPTLTPTPRPDTSRRTGAHWFILLGRKTDCRNKKEILIASLSAIERERPGTLEKLSKFKRRTRRIVARDRMDLFDVPSLRQEIDKYSTRLANGWWVGTNNSGPETEAWLRRACEYAGLAWGVDFRTSL